MPFADQPFRYGKANNACADDGDFGLHDHQVTPTQQGLRDRTWSGR
jgi:hypothetical protein